MEQTNNTIQKVEVPKIKYSDFLINQEVPAMTSKEYIPFWLKHIGYCKSGVDVGGVFISGWLYWHTNIFKLTQDVIDEWGNDTIEILSPKFRDNEFYIDYALERAVSGDDKKPLMIFGARRFGKSVLLASRVAYKAFIFQNTHALIIGASSADIGNITKYIDEFMRAKPNCFSDFIKIGDWNKTSSNIEIAFSKKEAAKKAKEEGRQLNPLTLKLFTNVNTSDGKLVFSNIAIRNLEHGQVATKGELLAGITPTEVIIDEALDEDTIIPTPNGFTTMKDLQVGDFVLGKYGAPTQVVRKVDVGVRTLYRVKLTDGRYLDACENHNWEVQEKQSLLRVKTPQIKENKHSIYCPDIKEYLAVETIEEQQEQKQSYCITVDAEDSLFLAGKYMVTGNCGKFLYNKQWLALKPALTTTRGTMRTSPLIVGCLTENNHVWDAKGNLVSIKDITKKTGILGFDLNNKKTSIENITYLQPPVEKECLNIKTHKGSHIECSTDHPILIKRREIKKYTDERGKQRHKIEYLFVEAKDIKVGDYLAMANSIDIFGEKTMKYPRLMGLLVGDGSYGFDKTPVLSNEDYEIWDYTNSLGLEVVIESQRITEKNRLYKECRIKGICPLLREIGVYGQTKSKKRLPKDISSYSKENICEFIGGLYDADGHFSNKYQKSKSITLTTVSREMVYDLKFLLMKLGVHSHITEILPDTRDRKIRSKNKTYLLGIYDKESILNYAKNIKQLIIRKQEALADMCSVIIKTNNNKKYNVDRSSLPLEKVVAITDVGVMPVYNLTAGKTNTYLANGIITHNTGGDVDFSKDAEGHFLSAQESGFTKVVDEDYAKVVKKKHFPVNSRNKNTGLFVHGAMANVEGSNISKKIIPITEYLNRAFSKEEREALEGFNIEVTDWDKMISYLESKNETTKDDEEKVKFKMYYPQQPEDCFLVKSNNPFPVEMAKKTRSNLEEAGLLGTRCFLSKTVDGRISYDETDKKPIKDFPFKGGAYDAPVVILQRPIFDDPSKIQHGMYVAGFDGYKVTESATTDSVGAFYIFKRKAGLTGYNRQIVAHIATRPREDKTFYRQVLLLLEAYNAELLPEYDTNLYNYLAEKNATHRLANCKSVVEAITPNSRANTLCGLPATTNNKKHYLQIVKDYCWEEIEIGFDKHNIPITGLGVERIHDPLLLMEIEEYRQGGNFDRIAAFGHALVWDDHLTLKGINPTDREYVPDNTLREIVRDPKKLGKLREGDKRRFIRGKRIF